MSLAYRVIPTFLLKGEMLVKGKQFASDRVIGHAYQAIMIQAARGVDEMVLLDVTATAEGRGPNLELVERLTDAIFCPLSVGGGIRSVEDVRALLRAGADKVVICTKALNCPRFLRECADNVGSQALTVALDCIYVRKGHSEPMPDWPGVQASPCALDEKTEAFWTVKTHCGKKLLGGEAFWMAQAMEKWGAGEILLQSIDRDGMMVGYDLELVRAASRGVGIPVIASGGAGTYAHMLEALQAGASAVAAGAMFAFSDQTPRGAAQYLAEAGIEVRL